MESGYYDIVFDEFFVFEKDRVSFEDVFCVVMIDDVVVEVFYNC